MSEHHIQAISLQAFNDVLSRYPSSVSEKLEELDTLRYDTIPAKVASRQDGAILTKDEVEKLVEWKLKHGTFRPKLLSLVQSNTVETIEDTAKRAYRSLMNADASPLPALKVLTELKGIGPATASLLMSVMRPETVPFFSDELFRWCCWDEAGSPGGWGRKIKYNVKEYEQLSARVQEIVKRLGVRAVDVEKVAWVLGKDKVNVTDGEEGEREQSDIKGDDVEDTKEVVKEKTSKKPAKKLSDDVKTNSSTSIKGTKRKAREPISPVEGVRKSSRTKK
ncbi:Nn.00g064550.m01.CDS01 [Neocucurbitaria sp. VM-36]